MKELISKNIVTNKSTDKIYEVAKNMNKYNIGFIPITKENKIIGVITDRDLATRILSNKIDLEQNIEDYITKNIIYIDINKNIDDACALMSNYKVKRLIVTDNKKMIGIISLCDIITKLNNDECGKLIKHILKKENNIKFINSDIDDFYL